jgi:hypothetical protein
MSKRQPVKRSYPTIPSRVNKFFSENLRKDLRRNCVCSLLVLESKKPAKKEPPIIQCAETEIGVFSDRDGVDLLTEKLNNKITS